MKGDSIVIEKHHRQAAREIHNHLAAQLVPDRRHVISIAGESGSGKSETAAALAEVLKEAAVPAGILQQDDYFVLPPRSNDARRRQEIAWVGPGEVRLDLMDEHLLAFVRGAQTLKKPLVIYAEDLIDTETMDCRGLSVLIVEGTYTTLLKHVDWRVFIDRDWEQTREHRERRQRDASELDPFLDKVLSIEHSIISSHKPRAELIVDDDYHVQRPD